MYNKSGREEIVRKGTRDRQHGEMQTGSPNVGLRGQSFWDDTGLKKLHGENITVFIFT